MKLLEVTAPPGNGGRIGRGLAIALIAVALSACAALGVVSPILDIVQRVAAVAGRPANTALDQTAAVVPAPNGTVGEQVVMRGTQGLIVAHNAYQTAAAVATAYVRSGQATPAQLARIRSLNDRAIALLETGGTGLSVAQRAAEVLNIVAELNVFGGRR